MSVSPPCFVSRQNASWCSPKNWCSCFCLGWWPISSRVPAFCLQLLRYVPDHRLNTVLLTLFSKWMLIGWNEIGSSCGLKTATCARPSIVRLKSPWISLASTPSLRVRQRARVAVLLRRVVYALRRLRVCPRSLGTRVGARSLARSLVVRYALRRERVYTQTHSHSRSHSRSHSPLLASARARLAPTKRARFTREYPLCTRFLRASAQLAIICERARNADSKTFETHYILKQTSESSTCGDTCLQ